MKLSLNTFCIKLIQKYQKKKTTSGRCRHYPCCSDYGLTCYQKFGFFKATFLTGYRILRCNPLSKKVYDPVPLSQAEKKEKKRRIHDLLTIKDILLKHHLQYPKMELQDDLVLLVENSLSNCSPLILIPKEPLQIEDIGLNRVRLYLNQIIPTQDYSIHMVENLDLFLDKIEIWQDLIVKKEIRYPYSKQHIVHEINAYLTSQKRICHSETYRENYSTNYYIVNKKDIQR